MNNNLEFPRSSYFGRDYDKSNKMKHKKLNKITNVFGGLFIASVIWVLVEVLSESFNPIAAGVCAMLFGATAGAGYEFAKAAKKDPKGFYDSFKTKGMIILMLIGMSFTCNGQSNRYESTEFNVDSIKLIDINVFTPYIDSSMQYHFCDKQPLDNIFIGDDSVLELINNNSIDLFSEYTKECFNNGELIVTESYLCATNDIEEAKGMISAMKKDKWWNNIYDSFELEIMDMPFEDCTVSVSDGINTYPIMRYEKYRIKTITTKRTHKTPTFPDFLNWIEERKTK